MRTSVDGLIGVYSLVGLVFIIFHVKIGPKPEESDDILSSYDICQYWNKPL